MISINIVLFNVEKNLISGFFLGLSFFIIMLKIMENMVRLRRFILLFDFIFVGIVFELG